MGAIIFFAFFVFVIPVGYGIVNLLERIGLLKPVTDPVEWDQTEVGESTNKKAAVRFAAVDYRTKEERRCVNQ
jgi:hypothetical protein